jgi:hypothetical protein
LQSGAIGIEGIPGRQHQSDDLLRCAVAGQLFQQQAQRWLGGCGAEDDRQLVLDEGEQVDAAETEQRADAG